MSVVVETPEVVPKPCNLFFIGQLWVAAPPWGAPSMFIPAGAAVTTCSSQDQHLSLAGYLLLNHSWNNPLVCSQMLYDHPDMQICTSGTKRKKKFHWQLWVWCCRVDSSIFKKTDCNTLTKHAVSFLRCASISRSGSGKWVSQWVIVSVLKLV